MSTTEPIHEDDPDATSAITRRPGAAIEPKARWRGLALLALLFVGLALAINAFRAGGLPMPVATTPAAPAASYAADPTIPPEARTKVFTSNQAASGQYKTNTITAEPALKASKTNPYTVKVETSLNTDPDAVARFVQATLDDPKGWASYGKNNFKLVTTDAENQLTIVLASPKTVDALCGASITKGVWDCRKGDQLVLNSDRWFYLTPTFTDVREFRAFQVNHQVGFYLGQKSASCKKKDTKAPVMADQAQRLDGCQPNAWPKAAA